MNLAHIHHGALGYGTDACRAQLHRLAALGVTHVALTPFGYVRSLDATRFRYGDRLDSGLTEATLIRTANDARALGMAVVLKPHVWSNAFWLASKSRQDMAPSDGDWGAWFTGFTEMAVYFAGVAERMGAALYIIGLEYLQATVGNPGAWGDVAAACRQHYGGPLTYAANWWQELDAFADWGSFDFVGVNAYHPLSKASDPTMSQLRAAWKPHLDGIGKVAAGAGKPVLFTEAGLRAVQGAAAEPWNHGHDGPRDEALQARAYEALLAEAMARPWFGGIYWWKWFTQPGAERGDDYAPTGRQAEAVLARWWG